MRRSLLILTVLGVALPSTAHALGLGDIRVSSALNQPLEAEVPIFAARPGEVEEIVVSLADLKAFEVAGVARTALVLKLRFEVLRKADGQPYVRIYTNESVREPVLSFLLEADWARGRLLREFNLLLDPPELKAARAAAGAGATAGSAQRPDSRPAGPAPVARPVPLIPASASTEPSAQPTRYGPVAANETLSDIALRTRVDGAGLSSMMIAYLRANPAAFQRGNINLLRRGVVLRVPTRDEVAAIDRREAVAEVAEHTARWKAGRGARVAQTPASPTGVATAAAVNAGAPAAGEPTPATSVATGRPAPDASAPPAVAAATAVTVTADSPPPRQSDLETARLRERIAALEEQLRGLTRVISVKEDQLTELQVLRARRELQADAQTSTAVPPAGSTVTDSVEPDAAGIDPERARSNAPVGEVAAPPVLGRENRISGSMVQGMALGVPMTLALGAGFLLLRRGHDSRARRKRLDALRARRAPSKTVPPVRPAIGGADRDRTPVNPETQVDVTEIEASSKGTVVETEQYWNGEERRSENLAAVPAMVDMYLVHDLHQEAEAMLREVIRDHPQRQDYRVKLLEIHYSAGDPEAFAAEAESLEEMVDTRDNRHWERVVLMGIELLPEHRFFREEATRRRQEAESLGVNPDEVTVEEPVETGPTLDDIGALSGAGLRHGQRVSAQAPKADEEQSGAAQEAASSVKDGPDDEDVSAAIDAMSTATDLDWDAPELVVDNGEELPAESEGEEPVLDAGESPQVDFGDYDIEAIDVKDLDITAADEDDLEHDMPPLTDLDESEEPGTGDEPGEGDGSPDIGYDGLRKTGSTDQ